MKKHEKQHTTPNTSDNVSSADKEKFLDIGTVILQSEELLREIDDYVADESTETDLHTEQFDANIQLAMAESDTEAIYNDLKPYRQLMTELKKVTKLLIDLDMSLDEYAEMCKRGNLDGLSMNVSYSQEVVMHPNKIKPIDELTEKDMWRDEQVVRTVNIFDSNLGIGIQFTDRFGYREPDILYLPDIRLINEVGTLSDSVGQVWDRGRILLNDDGSRTVIPGGKKKGTWRGFDQELESYKMIGFDREFIDAWLKINKAYIIKKNAEEHAMYVERERLQQNR